jgi:hypothetical protein
MAGDMVLWDSRVIHCNAPPTTARPLPKDGSLLPPRRLVAYVCMTPSSRLTPDIIGKRQEAFRRGHTSSHWPEEAMISGRANASAWRYKPPKLPAHVRKLVPLYEDDDDAPAEVEEKENSQDPEAEAAPRGGNNKRGGRNKRINPGGN